MKRMTKLTGGGSMWWYVLDADGIKVLGAAHEDDRAGMARLRANGHVTTLTRHTRGER